MSDESIPSPVGIDIPADRPYTESLAALEQISGSNARVFTLSGRNWPVIIDADDMWRFVDAHLESPWTVYDQGDRTFYVYRSAYLPNGRRYSQLLHRFILGLEYGDGRIAHHVNGHGFDNRRENLRVVTRSENNRLRRPRRAENPDAYVLRVPSY